MEALGLSASKTGNERVVNRLCQRVKSLPNITDIAAETFTKEIRKIFKSFPPISDNEADRYINQIDQLPELSATGAMNFMKNLEQNLNLLSTITSILIPKSESDPGSDAESDDSWATVESWETVVSETESDTEEESTVNTETVASDDETEKLRQELRRWLKSRSTVKCDHKKCQAEFTRDQISYINNAIKFKDQLETLSPYLRFNEMYSESVGFIKHGSFDAEKYQNIRVITMPCMNCGKCGCMERCKYIVGLARAIVSMLDA